VCLRHLFSDMQNLGRDLDRAVARFAAAVDEGDPDVAALAIGRMRGEYGVGISPSLDDLEAVHRIVLGTDPSFSLIRDYADAWAEGALGALLARGALDQRSGLATTDYLATRLRDLARTGGDAERVLVLSDPPVPPVPRLAAFLRSAKVARELSASFPEAETPVGIGDGARIVAIVPRDDGFEAHLSRARIAVGVVDGVDRGEVAELPLPSDPALVGEFVLAL
jgi:hypothetical protein